MISNREKENPYVVYGRFTIQARQNLGVRYVVYQMSLCGLSPVSNRRHHLLNDIRYCPYVVYATPI